MPSDIKVVHDGRGGYVEIDGMQYTIDHVEAGCFCIQFPSGHRHKTLQEHYTKLVAFAQNHDPKWYLGERKTKDP